MPTRKICQKWATGDIFVADKFKWVKINVRRKTQWTPTWFPDANINLEAGSTRGSQLRKYCDNRKLSLAGCRYNNARAAFSVWKHNLSKGWFGNMIYIWLMTMFTLIHAQTHSLMHVRKNAARTWACTHARTHAYMHAHCGHRTMLLYQSTIRNLSMYVTSLGWY